MIAPPPDEYPDEPPSAALPVEVDVYIEPDGTVVFADLAAGVLPIARQLNPDAPLACDLPHPDEAPHGVRARRPGG